jgi:MFS family permease
VTFLTGLTGFAVASAVGGASTSFVMLVTARACQGAFAALLAPAALGLLTTTFSDPKERGRAFGVYGAIAGGGGLMGLLLGGVLTEYLDWRWCLYVNLLFAGVAALGATIILPRQRSSGSAHLDVAGVLAVSGSMFCLVYGFSNAAMHGWHTPSTWGFLAAGIALLVVFGLADSRGASAAAAAGGARPQPRRCLLGGAPDRGRHVRHLLVPHLLSPDHPRVVPGGYRRRFPADDRHDHAL